MESKRVVVDLQQLDLLEQKIVKATELIRALRRERDAAQAKMRDLEAQLHASEKGRQELRELTEQLDVLREERQVIRGRVDQMLEMKSGYIQDLASYVDGKMREVSEATATVDSLKVAILAALNIADESRRGRTPDPTVVKGGPDRVARLIDMLERCFAEA